MMTVLSIHHWQNRDLAFKEINQGMTYLKQIYGFRYSHLIILLVLLAVSASGQAPRHLFTHAEPEARGFSSQKLDSLAVFLEGAGSSAMLLMVEGDIIFEWGFTETKYIVHSIRKALLNSLIGLEVAKGAIDTSWTIGHLKLDDVNSPLSEREKSARVADLLRSRSGVYHPAAAVSQGMLRGMPERDSYLPGKHYYYNNWDFNVLGAILEEKTGRKIFDLFKEQIAVPLGMHHYTGTYTSIDGGDEDVITPSTDGVYQYELSKSKYPAYHFRMSARDLALYGQLYLQRGNWNGEQIIPKKWIDVSTQPYSIYNERYGLSYGMLWYVLVPDDKHQTPSFYHTGAGIHMLGVYPSSKLVLVHRVDTEGKHMFKEESLYKMIRLVWGARIKDGVE